MSYGLYIGRNHTADGIAFLAGYGDEPSSHWIEINVAARHPADATLTIGVTSEARMPGVLSDIPQASETARNIRVEYSSYMGMPGPLTNGGLNEYGVAVRDIWATSRTELIAMTRKDQTGPNYSDLARMVVERAKTAREGVDIIGALIAAHGYSTYGGNSHIIADADEAWVVIEFAGGKGLWAAERLGPDSIRASRPGYLGVIPSQPNDDYQFPAHFYETAIAQGWYDPASGPFDVNKIYGDGKFRHAGVVWIEDIMREKAARAEKITLDDVFWAISTEKLTGDTAGYGQVVPLIHTIDPMLRMLWYAPVGPVTAPLLPVFLGQTSVPPEFQKHRYLTSGENHRLMDTRKKNVNPDTVSHVPQGIESSVSAVKIYKRLMHLAFQKQDPVLSEVWDHWRRVEKKVNDELKGILRAAEVLLRAGEPDLAAQILTDFSNRRLTEALAECRILADAAYTRLRISQDLNLHSDPISPPQIW